MSNVDASDIQSQGSTSLRYVIRDNHVRTVMVKDKIIGDYPILVTACLAIREIITINGLG